MNIDQIIGKLMGDQSIGEEKSALDTWKKEAEDNIKALEDIRKIGELSGTLSGYEDFNEDEAWAQFEQANFSEARIEKNDLIEEPVTDNQLKDKEEAKVFRLNSMIKVAASVVILIGAFFAFNNLNKSDEFAPQEFAYLAGSESISLDDGSEVLMDSNAKIRLTAPRTISMKGRASFDVAKSDSKQFTVKVPKGLITVLGTKFTITADNSTTEVYLEEGKINFTFDGRSRDLVPGELLRVVGRGIEVIKVKDVNYSSWKNKTIVFRNSNMEEVATTLSRHFDKQVELKDVKLFKDCSVMHNFIDYSLEEILNELTSTLGLKYELANDKVVIVSSKC